MSDGLTSSGRVSQIPENHKLAHVRFFSSYRNFDSMILYPKALDTVNVQMPFVLLVLKSEVIVKTSIA